MTTCLDVQQWVKKNRHSTEVYQGWDKRLFSKPYDEIVEYLKNRFKTTLNEVEYYLCMVYLWKHMDKAVLYVPFKESQQYKAMLDGTLTTTQQKTTNIQAYTPIRANMRQSLSMPLRG